MAFLPCSIRFPFRFEACLEESSSYGAICAPTLRWSWVRLRHAAGGEARRGKNRVARFEPPFVVELNGLAC
jgi:hypothetical protein